MKQQCYETIFRRLRASIQSPQTELIYHTPFELLVAVILSAQATDISVNQATKQLFKTANTPEQLLDLGEKGLKPFIKRIGLYHTKAVYLLKTAQQLIEHHGGQIPDNRAQLEALPGVGRKTANVVLNTLFDKPLIAVDTHVFRVSNRLKLATGKTPLQIEQGLIKSVPKKYLKDAHHLLLLHGRYVCKAKKPLCQQCTLRDLCNYF